MIIQGYIPAPPTTFSCLPPICFSGICAWVPGLGAYGMPWHSPQPPIHGCCSTWDNFGNENARIIRDVWIIDAPSNAKSEARITLERDGYAYADYTGPDRPLNESNTTVHPMMWKCSNKGVICVKLEPHLASNPGRKVQFSQHAVKGIAPGNILGATIKTISSSLQNPHNASVCVSEKCLSFYDPSLEKTNQECSCLCRWW